MKNNAILKCYVNGKKSAIICESGSMFLGSHTLAWNNTKLGNMYGWKFMYRLGDFSGVLTEAAAATMLAESGPEKLINVCFEGSEAYAKIRENITRRARKDTPAPEPAPAPMPEPVPAPAPVPGPAPKGEIRHEEFNTILAYVNAQIPVYLYGPAGSGKNVICEQIARALGLDFYFTNSVMDPCEIEGYRDAAGVYHETEFFRAFTRGGVFMLDEADGSIPEAMIRLNAALANRYFVFGGKRYIAHPDFRVIAAGNTIGEGATEEYNGRCKMDAATLDRFASIKIDYCKDIEKAVSKGDRDILEFVRDLRKSAEKNHISMILGYRCMVRLAEMKNALPAGALIQQCIMKGKDLDEQKILWNGLTHKENPYAAALCAAF